MAIRTQPAPLPASSGAPRPNHVAIIMDGNGRWAQSRGLPRLAGHHAGARNLRRVVQLFSDGGISYLTLYAFSTENWARPRSEVRGLWRLLAQVITREVEALHRNGVRLLQIGRRDRLSPTLQRSIEDAIHLTRNNTGLTLCVALDYGGRPEIVEAVRSIIEQGLNPGTITEETVSRHLYTAGIPDPDLVIRTGGEMRLSNFLLWQTAYSEYYATEACWPDFGEEEIRRALAAYAARKRRFGGLEAKG